MQFATATLHHQVTAATEHNRQALLLQSTETSANLVFIDIDWKSRRMDSALIRNMKLLAKTIAGEARTMNPSMLCISEVFETRTPLSEEKMQQVVAQVISA